MTNLVLVDGAVHQERGRHVREFMAARFLVRSAFRYSSVTLHTHRLETLSRPALKALVTRLLSRGGAFMRDSTGRSVEVGLVTLGKMANGAIRDLLSGRSIVAETSDAISALERAAYGSTLNPSGIAIYLRTDMWFGIESGGSVGHISGVLNNLQRDGTYVPLAVTTDGLPGIDSDVECVTVDLGSRYWDLPELLAIASNGAIESTAVSALGSRQLSFIYQRYSLHNFVGVSLATRFKVPLILEYNGSEPWIARNWGKPLKYEPLAERIELLDLHAAAVIVVVSQVMHDDLVRRGIPSFKILVNPNGVDPELYSPAVDGQPARSQLGLDDRVVVGFIGTFGPWHGAEVLTAAVEAMVSADPSVRDRLRLLLIGDGPRMSATKAIVDRSGLSDVVVFTGRTPQDQGPRYLAACDILVSPHVRNPDGSPFFGSPTKLFEYMAMGKAVVASRLDQISVVLSDDRTAVLVPPGDVDALAKAIQDLVDDPDRRARLGVAAREEAISKHTWLEHTRRILEKLSTTYA